MTLAIIGRHPLPGEWNSVLFRGSELGSPQLQVHCWISGKSIATRGSCRHKVAIIHRAIRSFHTYFAVYIDV